MRLHDRAQGQPDSPAVRDAHDGMPRLRLQPRHGEAAGNAQAVGAERGSAVTWPDSSFGQGRLVPKDASDEREQRMPPGTQLVIAVLFGVIVGMVGAMLWPARWWPW